MFNRSFSQPLTTEVVMVAGSGSGFIGYSSDDSIGSLTGLLLEGGEVWYLLYITGENKTYLSFYGNVPEVTNSSVFYINDVEYGFSVVNYSVEETLCIISPTIVFVSGQSYTLILEP